MEKRGVKKVREAFEAMLAAQREEGLPRLPEEQIFEEVLGNFLENRSIPNPIFEAALSYIRNTGGNATVEKFVEDHAPVGRQLWDDLKAAGLVGVSKAGKIFALEDADRFLIFMALLDPEEARNQAAKKSTEELVGLFERMTGWEHQRALSAFEVCVVKGFIDKK